VCNGDPPLRGSSFNKVDQTCSWEQLGYFPGLHWPCCVAAGKLQRNSQVDLAYMEHINNVISMYSIYPLLLAVSQSFPGIDKLWTISREDSSMNE
jgi:hypothetical protein